MLSSVQILRLWLGPHARVGRLLPLHSARRETEAVPRWKRLHRIHTEEEKNMTKEELRQYKSLKREKAQIEELLEEIELAKTAPKSPKIDGAPRGGSRQSGLEDIVAKYEEIERRYHAKLDEIAARLLAIEEAIETLDPTERLLCRCRYLKGLGWEAVCVKINYSWRQTHRIHAEALRKLRDK